MKNRLACILTVVMLGAQFVKAQHEAPGAIFYEKYMVEENTRYQVFDSLDTKKFTEQDWVMLSPLQEKREEARTVKADGSEEYRILVTESSQSEPWEHLPVEILSNEEGLTIRDKENQLLQFIPHSAYYLRIQDSLKALRRERGIPALTDLPAASAINPAFSEDSGVVISGDQNAYQLKTAQGEIEVNRAELYTVERYFQKEPGIPFYHFCSYQRTPEGLLVPRLQKSRELVITHGGFCVEKTQTRQYHYLNYFLHPEHAFRPGTAVKPSPFKLYPNPVENILQIEYRETRAGSQRYSVVILNSLNRVSWQADKLTTDTPQRIDISHLDPGIYYVRLVIDDQVYHHKILKL